MNLYWQLSTPKLADMREAKEARLGKLDARHSLTVREQTERAILLRQLERIDAEFARREAVKA
jgi:hypothetical protein